jgi:NAD(P)H-dependent FMN reductase
MPEYDERKTAIAKRLIDTLRSDLGNAWDNTLTAADRVLVKTCCVDAAELQLTALTVEQGTPEWDRLKGELRHVEAQLSNITAAVQVRLVEKFRAALRKVVSTLIGFAFAAA